VWELKIGIILEFIVRCKNTELFRFLFTSIRDKLIKLGLFEILLEKIEPYIKGN
jgi:hypothetical protein